MPCTSADAAINASGKCSDDTSRRSNPARSAMRRSTGISSIPARRRRIMPSSPLAPASSSARVITEYARRPGGRGKRRTPARCSIHTSVSTSSSATSLPLVPRRNSSPNFGRGAERCLNVVFGRQEAVDCVSNDLSHSNALTLGTIAQPNALLLGQVDLRSDRRHIHHEVYSVSGLARRGFGPRYSWFISRRRSRIAGACGSVGASCRYWRHSGPTSEGGEPCL